MTETLQGVGETVLPVPTSVRPTGIDAVIDFMGGCAGKLTVLQPSIIYTLLDVSGFPGHCCVSSHHLAGSQHFRELLRKTPIK